MLKNLGWGKFEYYKLMGGGPQKGGNQIFKVQWEEGSKRVRI